MIMKTWGKVIMVGLIIIGCVWVVVGICGAYRALDQEMTKYGGGPKVFDAILIFAAAISAAGISWALAVGVHVIADTNRLAYLRLTRMSRADE